MVPPEGPDPAVLQETREVAESAALPGIGRRFPDHGRFGHGRHPAMLPDSRRMPGRPRPAIAALPAYRPGRSAAAAEADHGIVDAIKLASNEAPFGPLPSVAGAAVALRFWHLLPTAGCLHRGYRFGRSLKRL